MLSSSSRRLIPVSRERSRPEKWGNADLVPLGEADRMWRRPLDRPLQAGKLGAQAQRMGSETPMQERFTRSPGLPSRETRKGLLRTSAPLFFLSGQLGINWEGGATEGRGLEGRSHWDYKLRKRLLNSQSCIPENLLSAAGGCEHIEDPTMKHLLFFTLSALLCCWVSADTRCHYCYKVPVVGCVDRQSCRLDPGQKCQTTNVYLGKMWVFSNLRCGTPEEPCLEAFNQTNHKLGLVYNTTCCDKDNCNSPAPRPTPALALISLTSLAGLGLWLLH